MFKRLGSTAAILFASALGLSAATLTVPLGVVTDTSPTLGGTLVLPQFNSSLGTLTGVELDFGAGSVSADLAISDIEPGGIIDITYLMGYEVTFTLPAVGPFVAEDAQNLNCSGSGPEIASCTNSESIAFSSISGSFDLSADLAAFLSGTVNVPYTPSLVETLVGTPSPLHPSNLNLSVTNESMTMPSSITFTYTPASGTPEPATLFFVGGGLIGLYGARRRRRSVQ